MSDTIIPTWTLGDRLSKARIQAGIGVQQMADLLACSRTTVANYEHDRTPVPLDTVKAYARHTRVAILWLIQGSDPDGSTGGGAATTWYTPAHLLTAA